MTLQNSSVQTPCAVLNSASTLPFITLMADVIVQDFSIAKKYCLRRSAMEPILKDVAATMLAAVTYVSHALLRAWPLCYVWRIFQSWTHSWSKPYFPISLLEIPIGARLQLPILVKRQQKN